MLGYESLRGIVRKEARRSKIDNMDGTRRRHDTHLLVMLVCCCALESFNDALGSWPTNVIIEQVTEWQS